MKISKIARLCKQSGRIWLSDHYKNTAATPEQWLSDGTGFYPIFNMPLLDEETVIPTLSFTDKDAKKMLVEHTGFPSTVLDCSDWHESDIALSDPVFCWEEEQRGEIIEAYNAPGIGAVMIQRKYIQPLRADSDFSELYLRGGRNGYVIVKQGLLLSAIILTFRPDPERTVKQIEDFAALVKQTSPESVHRVDPMTGELFDN